MRNYGHRAGRRARRSRVSWVAVILAAVAVLAAAGAAAFFIVPGVEKPALGEGDVILLPGEEGGLEITWPRTSKDSLCRISVYDEAEGEYIPQGEYTGNSARLPKLSLDKDLKLEFRAVRYGKNLLGMTREVTSGGRELLVQARDLPTPTLTEQTAENRSLSLVWPTSSGLNYEIFANGEHPAVAESKNGRVLLCFGPGEKLEMPSYERPCQLVIRAAYQGKGYILYSRDSDTIYVEKEALLGDELSLEIQESEERCYTIRWNETKGDYYELEEWNQREYQWESLGQFLRGEPLLYDTGKLASGSSHHYRVTARHNEPQGEIVDPEDPTVAAIPGELSFMATVSNQYCTVWPVVPLELYDKSTGSSYSGKVPAGTTLCVLEEENGRFYVRYGEGYGYVDSRYCLIDLQEYLGDYCAYDIANSYSAVYRIHGYPIKGVTGGVMKGYENILPEGEEVSLVPYLYPSAKKLLKAAKAAIADGYRLKIYDAFRPNETTRYLYDTTTLLLPLHVPAELDEEGRAIDPATGYPVDPYTGYLIEPETEKLLDPVTGCYFEPETGSFLDPVTGVPVDPATFQPPAEQPEETDGETAEEPVQESGEEPKEDPGEAPSEETTAEPAEEGGEPTLPPEEIPAGGSEVTEPVQPVAEPVVPEEVHEELMTPTYELVMTGGNHNLGAFLAATVSAHNRGIALDLTMEDLASGEEIPMQTAIHDLSWYSVISQNNDNAKLLAAYMTGAGLKELSSEWWHFQDNETREAIGLSSYLTMGLNPGGWKRDDQGWRYRSPEGLYYHDTTAKIGQKSYTFDSQGYVVE